MASARTSTCIAAVYLLSALPCFADEPSPPTQLSAIHAVCIDPGHGASNTGTMGFHGVLEKYLTLEVANRVERQLTQRTTARVIMTRTDDVELGLAERPQLCEKAEGSVFISLHANAAHRLGAHGIETFFVSDEAADATTLALVEREQAHEIPVGSTVAAIREDDDARITRLVQLGALQPLSEKLASTIQKSLVKAVGARDRGVRQAPFAVLRAATMPAVVVEMGFLTNRDEGTALLTDAYQDKLATALVDAIIEYDRALAPPKTPVPSTTP